MIAQILINKQGVEIIPIIYEDIEFFREGLVRVELDGRYGFINKQGKEIIPIIYDSAEGFNFGLAQVKLEDKRLV